MKKTIIRTLLLIAGSLANFNALAQQDNIPAKVKSVAQSKAGNQKIVKWVPDKQRGYYVVVLANGYMMTISLDGKWLNTSHPYMEKNLPAAISSAIKPYINKGYEVNNIVFIEDAVKGKYYTADLISDDEDTILFISPEGKILKKEKM